MQLLTKVWRAFSFNKALADLGLGSNGVEANVHRDLRIDFIEASLADGVSAKLAASKLFFVFLELGLISPSHLRIARGKLDIWAAKQLIPDPHDLQTAMSDLFAGRRHPRDTVEALCREVERTGAAVL